MATQQELNAIYQEELGRDVDPSGANTYADMDPDEVREAVRSSTEYSNRNSGGGSSGGGSGGGTPYDPNVSADDAGTLYRPTGIDPEWDFETAREPWEDDESDYAIWYWYNKDIGRNPTQDEIDEIATHYFDSNSVWHNWNTRGLVRNTANFAIKTSNENIQEWMSTDPQPGDEFHHSDAGELTIFNSQDAELFTSGQFDIGSEYEIGWYDDDGNYVSGTLEDYPGDRNLILGDGGTNKRTLNQYIGDLTGINELGDAMSSPGGFIDSVLGINEGAVMADFETFGMYDSMSSNPGSASEQWRSWGINDYSTYSDAIYETGAMIAGSYFGGPYGGAGAYTAVKTAHAARDQYLYGNYDWSNYLASIGSAWASAGIASGFKNARNAQAARNAASGIEVGKNGLTAAQSLKYGTLQTLAQGGLGTVSGMVSGSDWDEALIAGMGGAAAGQLVAHVSNSSFIPENMRTPASIIGSMSAQYQISRWAGMDEEQARFMAASAGISAMQSIFDGMGGRTEATGPYDASESGDVSNDTSATYVDESGAIVENTSIENTSIGKNYNDYAGMDYTEFTDSDGITHKVSRNIADDDVSVTGKNADTVGGASGNSVKYDLSGLPGAKKTVATGVTTKGDGASAEVDEWRAKVKPRPAGKHSTKLVRDIYDRALDIDQDSHRSMWKRIGDTFTGGVQQEYVNEGKQFVHKRRDQFNRAEENLETAKTNNITQHNAMNDFLSSGKDRSNAQLVTTDETGRYMLSDVGRTNLSKPEQSAVNSFIETTNTAHDNFVQARDNYNVAYDNFYGIDLDATVQNFNDGFRVNGKSRSLQGVDGRSRLDHSDSDPEYNRQGKDLWDKGVDLVKIGAGVVGIWLAIDSRNDNDDDDDLEDTIAAQDNAHENRMEEIGYQNQLMSEREAAQSEDNNERSSIPSITFRRG